MASNEPEKKKSQRLYIGNLGENITKEDIQTECSKYGCVKQIWLATRPKGFAYVDFEQVSEAEKAFEMLNATEALGSTKLEADIVEYEDDTDSESDSE